MVTIIVKSVEMAELERQKREKEIQIEYMEKQKQKEKEIERTVEKLGNLINKMIDEAINEGRYTVCKTLYKMDMFNFDYHFIEALDEIENIFAEAGYRINFCYYSKSWQKRSGKIGNLYVEWDKSE